MSACTEPGCTGTYVDGYCDVCGSPAAATTPANPAPVAAPPTGAAPVAVGLAPGRCTQPGCTGSYADGYCDVCGSPAPAGVASAPGPGPRPATAAGPEHPLDDGGATGPAGAASSRTRGSSRLDSAALGSRRAASSGSVVTARVRSGSVRMRAARLGAGLTRVPPAPVVDASAAVMQDPVVPEDKRSCSVCGNAVGRSREGRPGRPEGFCPRCGSAYSFTPKLRSGDVVAGQYEVAGCLAHGGLGWIYLARDRNVSNRWVVLKGLLNTGDADALAVAIVEQQFLAQVEHPLIVEIYNFVTHDEAGYIVMEYVGGVSLKQILKQRMRDNGGVFDPLPVDQALAYVLEVLPAFSYLHELGLVYCDFKPDNLIQVGDAVKLIDLGGVRRLDDDESAIYGTVGYQAPEVARLGTSVASDIYTIGRTLVVLMTEFRGYQTRYVATLPPVEETPLFVEHDSLYRLVAKACAPEPADRFASVDELRVQLLGVLREVVAAQTPGAALTSAASVLFEAPAVLGATLDWQALPALRADTGDAQHGWLANLAAADPAERLTLLAAAPADSPEVWLARGRAALELRRTADVEQAVEAMLAADPWEWRAVWLSGLSALQREDFPSAQAAFNAVYGQVPGELAPKLALALACERGGEAVVAESLYRTCAGTDATYVAPAAFGLARIRRARGDVTAAVAALDLVPSTSRGFTDARRLRASYLAEDGDGLPALGQAMASLGGVRIDAQEEAQLSVQILSRALTLVDQGGPRDDVRIGPHAARSEELRDGLEAAYRRWASTEADEQRRWSLVDRANEVRRWTLR
ncbi:tetratricopeptide repeat protein [Microlunatus capsulatus]|uniref:non-specific serine/threonine protein kinase n=1 Tax=Microlunatus capsulatus TaxID=99117 RepID=A0ABS4Z672_9ACTN|nr:serine/threonine-protein kinase [Microlunatus capsulatus]MBP2415768.1 serine/threonine-protein kinase PknG [Microlunatus capsulatus]